MKKIIGIDLGTTTSCVAVCECGSASVISTHSGSGSSKVMPSIVAYTDHGLKVGEMARRQAVLYPTQTISSIKRFMGKTYEDAREEAERMPYKVMSDENGEVIVCVNDHTLTPQQVSAEILKKLKKIAEDYLDCGIDEAVITVPAYFNQIQRQATKDAGFIAGLKVREILNEPTAAALAYGIEESGSGKTAVFDLGGGTFDISILECENSIFTVLSTRGDVHLGGDDLDHILMDHVIDEFDGKHHTDLRKEPRAIQMLKEACERAKIDLDTYESTSIIIPNITQTEGKSLHLETIIDRDEFEELCLPLLNTCIPLCEKALQEAGVSVEDIDNVLLVGAPTQMPLIRKMVRKFFHRTPLTIDNPEEIVAKGAAIQGGIINGDVHGKLLLDVTPLALGVMARQSIGSSMAPCWIIPENTTLPTESEETFSTVQDYQKAVDFTIVQGSSTNDIEPTVIGSLHLENITQEQQGKPVFHVLFKIDINGEITASARDEKTGELQQVPLRYHGKLTDKQLHDMRRESKELEERYALQEWQEFVSRTDEKLVPIRDFIEKNNHGHDRETSRLKSILQQYDEHCLSHNQEVATMLADKALSLYQTELKIDPY